MHDTISHSPPELSIPDLTTGYKMLENGQVGRIYCHIVDMSEL